MDPSSYITVWVLQAGSRSDFEITTPGYKYVRTPNYLSHHFTKRLSYSRIKETLSPRNNRSPNQQDRERKEKENTVKIPQGDRNAQRYITAVAIFIRFVLGAQV